MENSRVWLGQWGWYMGQFTQVRGMENGMMLLCSQLGSPLTPDMNEFSLGTRQIHDIGDNWSNGRANATRIYAWNTFVVNVDSMMWIPIKE